jgi:HEAT repeat protein
MAVQNLLELGHRECIDPVLSLIRSNRNDAEDRAAALTLLPQFIASPALTSKEALDVDIKCLNDPSALVRLTAARVLGDLGDQQNMSALESAIAREPEADIRMQMEQVLTKLKTKAQ